MKTIGDILTGKTVVALPADASVLEAAQAMAKDSVGAVLVEGADGASPGIFTERDLMVRVVVRGLDPAERALGKEMTADLFTATADDSVTEIAEEMQRRHIRHLPVVDEDGTVVAVLSFRDLLRAHLSEVEQEAQALTEYIQGEA